MAAIVELDGRFLMVEERISGRLVLNQPAGHLEDGETLVGSGDPRNARGDRMAVPARRTGRHLPVAQPGDGRSFLRFAFCGTVDDHRAQQPLDKGIQRALWMTHEQLLAQSLASALADGLALPAGLPARQASAARLGRLSRARIGAANGRRRQPVARGRIGPAPAAYNSRRESQSLRKNRRRHVRRSRLRGFGAAAEARRIRRARALHEQLGRRRFLLHRRAGFSGCARHGRRARAFRCIA